MVVAHLGHEHRFEADVGDVLAAGEAGPLGLAADDRAGLVPHDERLQFRRELPTAAVRERGGAADVDERAVVVVEAEEERADAGAGGVDAVAEHHDLGGAFVLHLQQGALARRVRLGEGLGDDAVEAGALELHEPPAGEFHVPGHLAEVDGGGHALEEGLEAGATLPEGGGKEVVAAVGEEVEGDEGRRGLAGEARDAALRRVDALGEGLPVEALPSGLAGAHDDLAVEDARAREEAGCGVDEFGEVACERLGAPAADLDAIVGQRDDAAEAVPLRLIEETAGNAVRGGDLLDGLRQHRRDDAAHLPSPRAPGRGLGGLLVLADTGEGLGVHNVRDREEGALGAVVPGSLAPAGSGEAAALAEEGEEDAGLLFTEAGQRRQTAEDLTAVRVTAGPDGGGVTVPLLDSGAAHGLRAPRHGAGVAVDGWRLAEDGLQRLGIGVRDRPRIEGAEAVLDLRGSGEGGLHRDLLVEP